MSNKCPNSVSEGEVKRRNQNLKLALGFQPMYQICILFFWERQTAEDEAAVFVRCFPLLCLFWYWGWKLRMARKISDTTTGMLRCSSSDITEGVSVILWWTWCLSFSPEAEKALHPQCKFSTQAWDLGERFNDISKEYYLKETSEPECLKPQTTSQNVLGHFLFLNHQQFFWIFLLLRKVVI